MDDASVDLVKDLNNENEKQKQNDNGTDNNNENQIFSQDIKDFSIEERATKLILIGDAKSGKTELVRSFLNLEFGKGSKDTIVFNIGIWVVGADNNLFHLCFPQTDCFIVTFAIDSRSNLTEAKKIISTQLPKNIPKLLVGCKKDLYESEEDNENSNLITYQEGLSIAEELGCIDYLDCSAKTKKGISPIFSLAIRFSTKQKRLKLSDSQEENRLDEDEHYKQNLKGMGTPDDPYRYFSADGVPYVYDSKKQEWIVEDQNILDKTREVVFLFYVPPCAMYDINISIYFYSNAEIFKRCKKKIAVGSYRYHCSYEECPEGQTDFCELCFLKSHHTHSSYKEKLYLFADMSWRLRSAEPSETLKMSFYYFQNRPCLGWKVSLDKYNWLTFEQVKTRAHHIGAGLYLLFKRSAHIGICSRNSVEWVLSDLGCIFFEMVSVPIHFTFDYESLEYIIPHADLECLICTEDIFHSVLKIIPKAPLLKYIVLLNTTSISEETQNLVPSNLLVFSLESIEELGKTSQIPLSELNTPPNKIVSITYTSGSTGFPKGVIIQSNTFNEDIQGTGRGSSTNMVYEPLAHSSRINLYRSLVNGGRSAIFNKEMGQEFFDDLRIVRPTNLAGVPAIWNKIYSQFNVALASLKSLSPVIEHPTIEKDLRKQFRDMMGGRIIAITTGGAPTSPEVIDFLNKTFQCLVFNSYGVTECGGISVNNAIMPDVECRLEDIPEMGYTQNDKPFPRGEIVVRTKTLASGYYKDPEATQESFQDGWFKTGDIGQRESDGSVRIIDRKKFIFKLSQGEFVSPSKIESILQKSKFVDQVFVTGNSLKNCIVAVVVINSSIIDLWIKERRKDLIEKENYNPCLDALLKKDILADFTALSVKAGLASYEHVRNIYLHKELFTIENSLLTNSSKLCRSLLKKKFEEEIKLLYSELENTNSLTYASSSYVSQSKLIENIASILHLDPSKVDPESDFTSLGGDSLSAVNLISELEKSFQIKLPIQLLYTNNISNIVKVIEGEKISSLVSHDQEAKVSFFQPQFNIKAEIFLDPEIETIVETTIQAKQNETWKLKVTNIENIFLTGATGFVGTYLLLSILQNTLAENIFCLVRANSIEEGKQKLKNSLVETGEFGLQNNYGFEKRVIPIIGDLSKPYFGLSVSEFSNLAEKIQIIYHSGARVNGILPYLSLKAENVMGTQEVIRLAVQHHFKQIHHISTLSVIVTHTSSDQPIPETISLCDDNAILQHCSGYALSKLVAEKLIEKARGFGLPCTIYRLGTISGNSKTGHCNYEAFIHKLICGIVKMKAFPSSNALFHLVPVDFLKHLIFFSQHMETCQGKVFHVTSPQFISFKQICQWIQSSLPNSSKLFEQIQFPLWKARIENSKSEEENPLFPLQSYFDSGRIPGDRLVSSLEFMFFLQTSFSINEIPQITEQTIHLYLDYFKKKSLI